MSNVLFQAGERHQGGGKSGEAERLARPCWEENEDVASLYEVQNRLFLICGLLVVGYYVRFQNNTAAEGSLAPNPGKLTSPIEAAISLLA